MKRLRALVEQGDLVRPVHALDPALQFGKVPLDASVHRADGCLVLEFEAADLADQHAQDPLASVQRMLASVDAAPTCRASARR